MIIEWKQERILMTPFDPSKVKGEVKTSKLTGSGMHRFYPGFNQIDDNIWKVIEPNLSRHIKLGNIIPVVESKKSGDKVKEVSVEITELDAEKAREIISGTYNKETLNAWRSIDNRDEIRSMLKDQIEYVDDYIKTGKKKKVKKEK